MLLGAFHPGGRDDTPPPDCPALRGSAWLNSRASARARTSMSCSVVPAHCGGLAMWAVLPAPIPLQPLGHGEWPLVRSGGFRPGPTLQPCRHRIQWPFAACRGGDKPRRPLQRSRGGTGQCQPVQVPCLVPASPSEAAARLLSADGRAPPGTRTGPCRWMKNRSWSTAGLGSQPHPVARFPNPVRTT